MPKCGSQCWMCDLPVRYDTYEGCTHGCKYCFVQRKKNIDEVTFGEGLESLRRYVNGEKTKDTALFDWNIPLHIGGMSDPFQPIELIERRTYDSMVILRDSGYPYVISTKGGAVAKPEYLSLLDESNAVVQISMVCSKYDSIEPGCPTFEERIEILKTVSKHCKRSIVRAQPYLHEVRNDVIENIKRFADAGAYGIILEGMKFIQKKKGLVKVASDFVYPVDILKYDFEKIRDEAHKCGLVFLCGENRLRAMGDSLTCCGVEGLDGFVPNRYNLSHLLNGDIQEPSEGLKKPGTANCFKAIMQQSTDGKRISENSFVQELGYFAKNKQAYVKEVLGK